MAELDTWLMEFSVISVRSHQKFILTVGITKNHIISKYRMLFSNTTRCSGGKPLKHGDPDTFPQHSGAASTLHSNHLVYVSGKERLFFYCVYR